MQFVSKSRCKPFGVILQIFCKSFLKVTFGFQFNKVQNSMFVFSSEIESIFSKHSFQVNMSKQFCEIHSSKSGLWIQLDQFNSILWIPYGFNYRHQTLNGPFSPVSKPIFANLEAFFKYLSFLFENSTQFWFFFQISFISVISPSNHMYEGTTSSILIYSSYFWLSVYSREMYHSFILLL